MLFALEGFIHYNFLYNKWFIVLADIDEDNGENLYY